MRNHHREPFPKKPSGKITLALFISVGVMTLLDPTRRKGDPFLHTVPPSGFPQKRKQHIHSSNRKTMRWQLKSILYSIPVLLLIWLFILQKIVMSSHEKKVESPQQNWESSKQIETSTSDYNAYPNNNHSCSDLFGMDRIVTTNRGFCREHATLDWISCYVGMICWNTSKIIGSKGGEPIGQVRSRLESLEHLKFEPRAITVGSLSKEQRNKFLATITPDMRRFIESSVSTTTEIPPFLYPTFRRLPIQSPCW
jgi:hypothetical protein